LGLHYLTVEVSRSHTIRQELEGRTPLNDQLVMETTTYTTNNKHKRRTSMPSAGFQPMFPAIKHLSDQCLRPHGLKDLESSSSSSVRPGG
jgi:hypothetical protein